MGRHYHRLVQRHFAFLIPPGARVLELGCGLGDLLAAVKPARGVGVDFSPGIITQARTRHPGLEFHVADAEEFSPNETFDYIILSDMVNDVRDVELLLVRLRAFSHPRTRLVVNIFNNLWRPILNLAEALGAKAPTPVQNWLSADDLKNLLYLSGWETIKTDPHILWPLRTPLLDPIFNRWLAPIFTWFCLTNFLIARPRPPLAANKHHHCSVIIPARNEAGNIEAAVLRSPIMGLGTELIFIEGHSKDNTWAEIQRVAAKYPHREIKVLKQQTKGKGGAVREAFAVASGDLLFILDADLTMPPEQLPKFYEAARSGAQRKRCVDHT